MKKVGFIINPIAGMGGSVGLKGTDGEIYKKALLLGAKPIAPQRVNRLLSNITKKEDLFLLVAPGKMGADLIEDSGINFGVIGEISEETSAKDTVRIAKQMMEKGIELLIFCGGDGTARDIYDAIDLEKPVIAIPAGVKMFSSVFAYNPRAAAQLIDYFLADFVETVEKEVLDIDEDLVREDVLKARLYGFLKVPKILSLIQPSKEGSSLGKTIEENKQEIAQFIVEEMENDVLYILGPGTTVKAITERLNLTKTLLGVDAVYNKKIVGIDLNEKGILELIAKYVKSEIVISPIGGQFFIFGRGNKQFTPKILKLVGNKNIKIIATKDKIRDLDCLRVDTGDLLVDEMFSGFARIITGYMEYLITKVEC
ncbi:MAG: ATP-NAD kinase family protein [Promethearchaeota archaeon]